MGEGRRRVSREGKAAGPIRQTPPWLWKLLGVAPVPEGSDVSLAGGRWELQGGILRAPGMRSRAQEQTSQAFGFKWQRRETFESETALARTRAWLVERYGDVSGASWWPEHGSCPVLLDAGCGAGMAALALLGTERLRRVRYLGADISMAVDVAASRFTEHHAPGAFLQSDLMALPLPGASVDVILAEGVLHHTDSTREGLAALVTLLAPGGRLLFYVYRRKGPIREFTDDYVRARLAELPPEQAWESLRPLTRLGQALGELHTTVDVPEPVDLLGIPAGPIDVQRLFYWHVAKLFHHPHLTTEEMHHINFDWYAPRNAHRQSPEEVQRWCEELGLRIEREVVEEAGITIIARRG